ncbi:Ger(x)C family spore germination protein [Sporomusa acidovorans]|nr:Ger(x)C family spore germination protein [Sporomusa acidovorans]
MKNKFVMIFIVLLLLPGFIGGCGDMHNVDELAIVLGTGIDRIEGDEPILLTVQVVNTAAAKGPGAEGGGQEVQFITLTSQGKTMLDAVQNLAKISPRKLLFSHNKIVVLGKDFAESDISEAMDFLQRSREFRLTNLILVAERTAKEILETRLDIAKLPALGLHAMLVSKDQTFIYPVNINDFLLNLKTDIGVSYAPIVRLQDLTGENKAKLEMKDSPKINLHEMAIFKDNRLVGTLNDQEAKGLLWLINKLKKDTVIIPYPEGNTQFSLIISKGDSKIIPHITDKTITLEIICTGEAELREADYLSDQIKDLRLYKQLEQEAEKLLQAKVEQTIAKAQSDLKTDFIGFGNQIHNANPNEWHQIKAYWDQYFPEINYTVTFRITINKAGIIKGSATSKKP